MKNRSILLPLMLSIVASIPATAQQINNVLQNNSSQAARWNDWASIYGTNLPVNSGTFVSVTYPESFAGGYGSGRNDIYSSSSYQTYWYDSSTQINFYLFAVHTYGGTPVAGCVYYYPNYTCDNVVVCSSGLCSNTFTTTFQGIP